MRALILNCTLKASPEPSNTEALLEVVAEGLRSDGIDVDTVRIVDHDVKPGVTNLVVLLGATAAQAVLGPKVRVTRDRGQVLPAHDELPYDTLVTIHPSAVLRTKPPERDVAFDALVRDLRVAAQHSEP